MPLLSTASTCIQTMRSSTEPEGNLWPVFWLKRATVNRTGSPNAGDVVASAFVRALVADGRVDVRDPGIVRGALLQNRIILEGGVSHESARVSLGSMDVDVVVSGNVRGFEDGGPSVEELPSTVVDVTAEPPRVIRRGVIDIGAQS